MEPIVKIHLSCFSWDKSRVEDHSKESMVPGPLVPPGKDPPYDLHLI